MLIDWSDDYLVGIEMIDGQHKEFFNIVHRFYDASLAAKEEDLVQETLDFLREYALKHFEAEEALMRKHEYPRVEEHLKLHEEFLTKYADMIEEYKEVGTSQDLADEIAEMVQSWLVEHIAETDTDYVRHMKSRA